MADNEKLTPEEEDVRNQAMLHDLRYMHAPVDTAQSLERMRNRLLATELTSTINSMQTPRQFMRKAKQERIQSMNSMQVPIAQKKGHYLNMLIAGIIATLLVGSLLFAVTHVYQSNTGSGGPTNSTHVSKPTPSPTCAPGSKPTPTPVPGVFPTPLPTPVPGSKPTLSPTCAPGSMPTPLPTVAPGSKPTPTPVPGVFPTPLPTPVPGSMPTPAPTIMPTPTLAPGSFPTPAPFPTPTQAPGSIPTPIPTIMPTPTPAPSH